MDETGQAKKIALAITAAIAISSAEAQEQSRSGAKWETPSECKARLKDEIACFSTHARAAVALCSMQFQLAALNGEFDSAHGCVETSQAAMVPLYQAALKRVGGKKGPSGALRDAYAFWLSAIRTMSPDSNEAAFSYRSRIAASRQGVEERLARLELAR